MLLSPGCCIPQIKRESCSSDGPYCAATTSPALPACAISAPQPQQQGGLNHALTALLLQQLRASAAPAPMTLGASSLMGAQLAPAPAQLQVLTINGVQYVIQQAPQPVISVNPTLSIADLIPRAPALSLAACQPATAITLPAFRSAAPPTELTLTQQLLTTLAQSGLRIAAQ